MDVSSPDVSSPLNYQLYGNGKIGMDASSKGTQNQLLERQVTLLLKRKRKSLYLVMLFCRLIMYLIDFLLLYTMKCYFQ